MDSVERPGGMELTQNSCVPAGAVVMGRSAPVLGVSLGLVVGLGVEEGGTERKRGGRHALGMNHLEDADAEMEKARGGEGGKPGAARTVPEG